MSQPTTGIEIGGRSFATKARLGIYIADMLARYRPGEVLVGEDDAFLRALIERHPRKAHKIGAGIASIFVQDNFNLQYPQARRFVIRHTDGSVSDIGWRRCIEPVNAMREVASQCRWLVHRQILEFRNLHFAGRCDLCGDTITECHVDHIPPDTFDRLLRGWLRVMRLEADQITILGSPGYEQPSYFEDDVLTQEWIEYHSLNARLRCLCRRCNLSTLRKSSPAKLVADGT